MHAGCQFAPIHNFTHGPYRLQADTNALLRTELSHYRVFVQYPDNADASVRRVGTLKCLPFRRTDVIHFQQCDPDRSGMPIFETGNAVCVNFGAVEDIDLSSTWAAFLGLEPGLKHQHIPEIVLPVSFDGEVLVPFERDDG